MNIINTFPVSFPIFSLQQFIALYISFYGLLYVKGDFENTWIMYNEQPCCKSEINHHLRHHKDYIREFMCGKMFYRTSYLDEEHNSLYVGGMNRIYKLNLNNINQTNCERDVLVLNASNVGKCRTKGKPLEYHCQNHIRVIQPIGDGNKLYVCGTNAYDPMDWVININLTHLSRDVSIPGIGSGIAKCPYDPNDNSTAIWVENGNRGNLPALYSATIAEFSRADSVIFRNDLYNFTTHVQEYSFKRTDKYNTIWLDQPNYVNSFDVGEYVFFFFRENAVEFINCGKKIFSRVARVCKKDNGGKNVLRNTWTTYLKARLNCSIAGEFPFYFNEIQSVFKMPSKDIFYATFTTSANGLFGSAICKYSLSSIQSTFDGKFKIKNGSLYEWLPVSDNLVPTPRPGVCVEATEELPDVTLNFIRQYPIMDSAVPHDHNKPIYYTQDAVFTKIVVDIVHVDAGRSILNYTVYYVGTNMGKVYKIVEWNSIYRQSKLSSSRLIDVFNITFNEPIQFLELSKQHQSLIVGSDSKVVQIDLVSCSHKYDNCLRCIRDPYCGWESDTQLCKPYMPGLLQDVERESDHMCDANIIRKKVIATWGQSLHLACFEKLPSVFVKSNIKWYHYSKINGRYEITSSLDKYIRTFEEGLVIMGISESDKGQYDCLMDSTLLCSFNVTVDSHRCSPPIKSNEYQKIYSDWCHEFEKYKSANKLWEKKKGQCTARLNNSNQNNHPNEIYRPFV